MQQAQIYRVQNPKGIDLAIDRLQTELSSLTYLSSDSSRPRFWFENIYGICEPNQHDLRPFDPFYNTAQPDNNFKSTIFFADLEVSYMEGVFSYHKVALIGWIYEKMYNHGARGHIANEATAAILSVLRGSGHIYKVLNHSNSRQVNARVFEGFNTDTFEDQYDKYVAIRVEFEVPVTYDYCQAFVALNEKC